jgi:hypothetical protein
MNVTTTVARAHEELLGDHQRLRTLVDRLRERPEPDALFLLLDELHAALVCHFNAEERPGGLYDTLGACVPELRTQLSGLVDDHFRITAALRDLRERARQDPSRAGDSLQDAAWRLAQVLGEHEKRELAMVDAAILRGA